MGTASFKSFDPGGTRRYFTSAGSEIFSSLPASVLRTMVVPEMLLIVTTAGAVLSGAAVCADASALERGITAGNTASTRYAQLPHIRARRIRSLNLVTLTFLSNCR